jgi:hypothetical protein
MFEKPLVRENVVTARARSAFLRAGAVLLVAAAPLSCGSSNDADEQAATDSSELLFRRRCSPGFADCDGRASNGCEVALATDVGNCGACGNVCSEPHAFAACTAGVCKVAACSAGFGDCDGQSGNGCETDLAVDPSNCGACGNVCAVACSGGVCTGVCVPGSTRCSGSGVQTCGADGTWDTVVACSTANGVPACTSGVCVTAACNSGFGDCDGQPGNGCETDATTNVANCGACGTSCGSGGVCVNGVCFPALGNPPCGDTSAGVPISKGVACVAEDPQLCYNTCGPISVGFKSETCSSGGYEEGLCAFPPGDYSCFKVPTADSPGCPTTPPQQGQPCDIETCSLPCTGTACSMCGVAAGYLASNGIPKTGYCVCVAGAAGNEWNCASVNAWPCPGGQGC